MGYWDVLEPYWEKIDIYGEPADFLAAFNAVHERERTLFAAHWCESEVANGGFHQFFYNSTGVLAPEAAQAYRAVGLADVAAILEEAMSFFGSPYPRDRSDRMSALPEEDGGRDREEWDPFFALNERLAA